MKVKRARDVLYLVPRKNNSYANPVLIALVFTVLLVAGAYIWYQSRCEDRVRGIRVVLSMTRRGINAFYGLKGRYPESINEFRQWSRGGAWDKMIVDLTSDKQSKIPEYHELNDKGGYYYDPNTGEIRLNLTRPVREYLKFYSGSNKDQIPSSW